MRPDEPQPPLVSPEKIRYLAELASKIAQSEKGFNITPPKMVVDDPSILKSEQVVERLMGTTWLLRPAIGGEERLSLPELVTLLFNLFAVRQQIDIGKKTGFPHGQIEFELAFDVPKLMMPEIVRGLLSNLQIVRNPAKPPG